MFLRAGVPDGVLGTVGHRAGGGDVHLLLVLGSCLDFQKVWKWEFHGRP